MKKMKDCKKMIEKNEVIEEDSPVVHTNDIINLIANLIVFYFLICIIVLLVSFLYYGKMSVDNRMKNIHNISESNGID